MKKFRFRLHRVERWRRQEEKARRAEHDISLRTVSRSQAALAAHDEMVERLLAEEATRRASGDVDAESLVAADEARGAFASRREALAAAHAEALEACRDTLARLVEARRSLEAVEGLGQIRRSRWQREVDVEMQKQSDEFHRMRLRFREEDATPGGTR